MITKIISAFPGTGKSYFASISERKKIVDLDSGDYTLGYMADGKIRNPDFPNNYLLAIKEQIGKADILFVGCQPETIAALRKEGIPFTLAYPARELKGEYINRFKKRANSELFINLLSKNWDLFLDFLESQKDCERIVLGRKQYISDALESPARLASDT
ncbi:MAG TPA: hypothetical protein VJM32_01135 [Candidatus Saccharimonadales bacterium]|nr:hypothetical protein [Candidatus Saccharimonadales bacterium]